MSRGERIVILVIAIVCAIGLVAMLGGCNGRFDLADNTASGGGRVGFDWSRCTVETMPIGGNAAAVPNKTTKGGGTNVLKP